MKTVIATFETSVGFIKLEYKLKNLLTRVFVTLCDLDSLFESIAFLKVQKRSVN